MSSPVPLNSAKLLPRYGMATSARDTVLKMRLQGYSRMKSDVTSIASLFTLTYKPYALPGNWWRNARARSITILSGTRGMVLSREDETAPCNVAQSHPQLPAPVHLCRAARSLRCAGLGRKGTWNVVTPQHPSGRSRTLAWPPFLCRMRRRLSALDIDLRGTRKENSSHRVRSL